MSAALLRYQIHSSAWANRTVLSAAARLTPEELTRDFRSSERSILGSLVHICRSERAWLARIGMSLVEYCAEGDDTMPALTTNWPNVTQGWVNWSNALTDQVAHTALTYRDLRGNEWTTPIWQIVLHVVNHSTHHRGQAIAFLRALGHTPPNTDSITFARQSRTA